MNVTVSPLPQSQVKLTIELSPAEMSPYLDKAAETLSRQHKIEGFRPGKASLGMVIQKLGAPAVWQEAAEGAIRKSFVAAIRQENIKSIGHPQIAITKLAPDNPFIYTAEVATLPTVKVGDYQKLKARAAASPIKDDDVAKALEELRAMFATEALVERAAQHGDKVEVDFDVAVNNVPIENGASKQHPVVIGSGNFIPGFEEQLVGLKKGESKKFTLTFPEKYHKKDLAGKPAEFSVTVTSIFQVHKPELNDAFIKQVGKFESIDQLKSHLRGNLENEAQERSGSQLERAVVEELVSTSKFDPLPELLIESEIGKMLSELREQVMRQGGIKYEEYLQSIQKTEADLRREFRKPGEERVKAALVIRAVAEAEKITVEDKDIETEVQSTLKMYEHDPEVKEKIDTEDYRDYVRAMLVNRKVIELLKGRTRTA